MDRGRKAATDADAIRFAAGFVFKIENPNTVNNELNHPDSPLAARQKAFIATTVAAADTKLAEAGDYARGRLSARLLGVSTPNLQPTPGR